MHAMCMHAHCEHFSCSFMAKYFPCSVPCSMHACTLHAVSMVMHGSPSPGSITCKPSACMTLSYYALNDMHAHLMLSDHLRSGIRIHSLCLRIEGTNVLSWVGMTAGPCRHHAGRVQLA